MNKVLVLATFYFVALLSSSSLLMMLITAPIAILVGAGLIRNRAEYVNPEDIYWFLIFLYFVFAPLLLFDGGRFGTESATSVFQFTDSEVARAGLLVILFLGAFSLTKRRVNNLNSAPPSRISWSRASVIACASFGAYVFIQGGFDAVLLPRREIVDLIAAGELGGGRPFAVVVGAIHIASTHVLLATYISRERRRLSHLFFLVISLGLLALAYNPLNTPRFVLVMAWLPALLICIKIKIKAGWFYLAALLFIFFAMPVLDVTTRTGNFDAEVDFSRLKYVDVFDTLVYAVRFVDEKGLTLGSSILGTLTSLLPSSLVPGRPPSAGVLLGTDMFRNGATTENLSFFIGGDFFVDFHFAGAAIAGLACGILFYRVLLRQTLVIGSVDVAACGLIAVLPIAIRGPLAYGILANVLSLVCSYALVARLCKGRARVNGSES